MKKLYLAILLLFLTTNLYASPTNSISVTPVAVDGAVIQAADENNRNSTISSAYNSHSHEDITKLGTVTTGVWTGTVITVSYGGTGAATLTDGGVLLGSGTGAITPMAVLSDGQIIIGDGTTDPTVLSAFSSSTGTLNVASGGTGQSSYTNGQLLIGNTTGNTLTKATLTGTADEIDITNSTGSITIGLINPLAITKGGTGSASTAYCNLASNVTGTLPIASGGTGQTTAGFSNVIYCWSGSDSATTNLMGMVEGTSLTPNMGAYTVNYHILGSYSNSPNIILRGRFTKAAVMSTITIHARLWSDSANALHEAILTTDIGGQSNTVKSVTSTTPTWVTTSTIDVSGLTNGTVYDITISLHNEGAQSSYCSGVVLIAS
jgi:hypothetical protein